MGSLRVIRIRNPKKIRRKTKRSKKVETEAKAGVSKETEQIKKASFKMMMKPRKLTLKNLPIITQNK